MLITLTGAYKNAGDHLIGYRARSLLRAHSDPDVVNIDRKQIDDESYELFNKARAVLLTGGPAYQQNIYPGIYDLDLSRINVPVIAYGLGWKSKLDQLATEFRFSEPGTEFVKAIHSDATRFSSARDHLTVQMLAANGVANVAMTGCPAWYDEEKLNQDYQFPNRVQSLVLSMPAVPNSQTRTLMKLLAKQFPRARKYLSFQAGFVSTHSKKSAQFTKEFTKTRYLAKLAGWKSVSFENDFDGFVEFMSKQDFHIGYRVHSHIYSISQRITSMLIAEDSRGIGQAEAMGSVPISVTADEIQLKVSLEKLLDTKGESITQAVSKIRATHPEMLRFIKQL